MYTTGGKKGKIQQKHLQKPNQKKQTRKKEQPQRRASKSRQAQSLT
jgi:hypothetical protein